MMGLGLLFSISATLVKDISGCFIGRVVRRFDHGLLQVNMFSRVNGRPLWTLMLFLSTCSEHFGLKCSYSSLYLLLFMFQDGNVGADLTRPAQRRVLVDSLGRGIGLLIALVRTSSFLFHVAGEGLPFLIKFLGLSTCGNFLGLLRVRGRGFILCCIFSRVLCVCTAIGVENFFNVLLHGRANVATSCSILRYEVVVNLTSWCLWGLSPGSFITSTVVSYFKVFVSFGSKTYVVVRNYFVYYGIGFGYSLGASCADRASIY